MSILRTPEQAVLQDALILTQESTDRLEDAVGFVDDESTRTAMATLAGQRSTLAKELAETLRSSGDLPSAPNVDREDAGNLVRRVHAWLTPEATTADFLDQLVAAERKLGENIAAHMESDLTTSDRQLLERVMSHVEKGISQLETLASNLKD